jgi:hypothetical protein
MIEYLYQQVKQIDECLCYCVTCVESKFERTNHKICFQKAITTCAEHRNIYALEKLQYKNPVSKIPSTTHTGAEHRSTIIFIPRKITVQKNCFKNS